MPRRKPPLPALLPAPVARPDGARLAEAADQYLRELVLDGPLASGAPVPIEEIALRLGVSRQPVRDAVNRMAADGLLEVIPQVGCRVARPDAGRVADFFRLFAAVEAVVAALAAERCTVQSAEELRSLARAASPAGSEGPSHRRVNRAFYAAIHAIAASHDLTAIAEGLWDRSDFYLRCAFGAFRFGATAERSHREMAEAIIAGDAIGASATMRAHLERIGELTSRQLAEADGSTA